MPLLSVRDVKAAIDAIGPGSVPLQRRSTKHCLIVEGRHYPSKQVVFVAFERRYNKSAKGHFRGGAQIDNILKPLGYVIEEDCELLPSCQDWCVEKP